MTDYDFTALLSPLDFELLSKDLLERELGISIENFAEGRDAGIDLRYAPASPRESTVFDDSKHITLGRKLELIVQCKRFSNYSNLKSELRNKEFLKIKKLNPARYILTTSVSLSQQQVSEIQQILSPYILSSGDIFGQERINSLLANYPDIERRHIKLWLGSTGVLESILHAGIHVISREEVEKTISSAKVYVKNPSFDEALDILKEHRVCIISGIPGIGKTTLARMLLLYFYGQKFDVVKISGDVSEARNVEYHKRARFYYYDDFLGQTGQADKLNKNEDQRLLDFMSHVRDSKSSVFVLTTREYILNQARIHYEKIDRARFDHTTCIVDLSKYSRQIKAEILYNHLYYSKLPRSHISTLVTARGYLRIVDHNNYNPRLIEYLTDPAWVGDIEPCDYLSAFLHNLDNPAEIWGHAFQRQLSIRSRHLLYVLTTMPSPSAYGDLKIAFDRFHAELCERHGMSRSSLDFKSALKELDGTFISTESVDGLSLVRFHNPSIRDFMQSIVIEGEELVDTINNIHFFEQAHWFIKLLQNENPRLSLSLLKPLIPRLLDKMHETYKVKGCAISIEGNEWRRRIRNQSPSFSERISIIISATQLTGGLITDEWASGVIADIIALYRRGLLVIDQCLKTLDDLKGAKCDQIPEWTSALAIFKTETLGYGKLPTKFEIVVNARSLFPDLYSDQEVEELSQEFELYLDEYDDFSDFMSPEDFRAAAEYFSDLALSLGASTMGIVDLLEEKAEEKELEQNHDWDGDDDRRPSRSDESCSDNVLDSMFGTLHSTE